MFILIFLVLITQEAIILQEVLVVFLSFFMLYLDACLIAAIIERIKR